MKRFFKLLFFLVCAHLAYIVITLAILPPISNLANLKYSATIQVRDWQGKYRPFIVGHKNRYWAPSSRIPPEMKWAAILAEDDNFYKHGGFDVKAIKEAIKYDLKKKSFARGASTITQQTAKNLFLSREKSITRKIKELYLARRMERELTKERIIELYLNVVELGPMVHGVGHGARYYFGKDVSRLTPRESAFLAAMLPGPRVAYNPYKNLRRVLKRSNMILKLMRQRRVLDADEYRAALAEQPNISGMQRKVDLEISQPPIFDSLSSEQTEFVEPDISEIESGGNDNEESFTPQNETEPPSLQHEPADSRQIKSGEGGKTDFSDPGFE